MSSKQPKVEELQIGKDGVLRGGEFTTEYHNKVQQASDIFLRSLKPKTKKNVKTAPPIDPRPVPGSTVTVVVVFSTIDYADSKVLPLFNKKMGFTKTTETIDDSLGTMIKLEGPSAKSDEYVEFIKHELYDLVIKDKISNYYVFNNEKECDQFSTVYKKTLRDFCFPKSVLKTIAI